MKRLALAITLSALAAITGFYSAKWTKDYIETGKAALSADLSAESLLEFRKDWDRHRKIFACFIEENHLEKAEDCLRRAEIALSLHQTEEAALELSQLPLFLQDIADYCSPTFDNIF